MPWFNPVVDRFPSPSTGKSRPGAAWNNSPDVAVNLVGGFWPPLWKILVNWDDYSQYMENKIDVPNHQRDDIWLYDVPSHHWSVSEIQTSIKHQRHNLSLISGPGNARRPTPVNSQKRWAIYHRKRSMEITSPARVLVFCQFPHFWHVGKFLKTRQILWSFWCLGFRPSSWLFTSHHDSPWK